MNICHTCGIPVDAGYFDEAGFLKASDLDREWRVLTQYQLHSNYCGVLLSFAQFTDLHAQDNSQVETPGLEWQVRCDSSPRDPYLTLKHILNPWGYYAMPVQLRLAEGSLIDIVVRKVGDIGKITRIGGRITGRYWYNTDYGGAPNRL